MFHTESRLSNNQVVIRSFDPRSIFPLVSEGLLKYAIGMQWQIGHIIKKGYHEESSGNCSYQLTTNVSFKFCGVLKSSLPCDMLTSGIAKIVSSHQNQPFYGRGAYFIPVLANNQDAQYEFYYLDCCLFADEKQTKYYVVDKKLDIQAGQYGQLYHVVGAYKHKYSVIGPKQFIARCTSKPVIIKAGRSSADNPDQKFHIMFQNEVNGMRAQGDLKVKSSLLFTKSFGGKDYQFASHKHQDHAANAYPSLESVIMMPLINGFTLEELYEAGTPSANARRHAERLELEELQARVAARNQGDDPEGARQDELLRLKIKARDFLRSEEGRLIVARQCVDKLLKLHAKNIIHCDLKDTNIMVEINYLTLAVTVKFIDYGFSRNLSDPDSLIPYVGYATGSVAQMAPELLMSLIDGRKVFNSVKTDEYALGIVLLAVFGDTLVSSFSAGIKAYAKMRCEQNSATHQLFHKLNYHPTIKEQITSIFNQWLLRDPYARLPLTDVQVMLNQVAEAFYKLKDPAKADTIVSNHRIALNYSRERSQSISPATHLHYAFAMCVQLKAAIIKLQDNPAAIKMYAHSVNIAAFMHLESKAALLEAVDLYHTAYETSYQACQNKLVELKQLQDQMVAAPTEKKTELSIYLDHACLFMRTREQKRCQLDELAVEAEHMTRKSEKMSAVMNECFRPAL